MQVRRLVQALFLAIFIFLMIIGKQQVWFLFFLIGILGALLWGRFYCGWLCPINTSMDIVDKIYKKLDIKRREVPKWAKNPWVRRIMLLLFFATIIAMVTSGQKIPVLLILTIMGVVLSLFFVPAFWHRYLCPYGTILNLTGNKARKHYYIQQENCTRCNKCRRACPAEAVIIKERKDYPIIDKGLCLICAECVNACPEGIILYGRDENISN